MALSVIYFRIMHRLCRPHYVWDEYLYSVLWENNINHDLREVDYTGDDWKTLAEDREIWRAYIHAVMNLQVR